MPRVRRVGYLVAVLLNAAVLVGLNVWPGWESLPWLTPDASQVVGWVNVSILVSLVANLVYAVHDEVEREVGDAIVTAVGLVVLVRVWQVYPFEFASGSFGDVATRALLPIAIVGSVIALVVKLVTGLRALTHLR